MILNQRLVLRFDEGQFSFTRFAGDATNDQLHGLAHALNRFQEPELRKVIKITVTRF